MTFDKDVRRRDRSELARVLIMAGAEKTHARSICCPFHDDTHPSAEIKQVASGTWYFYCHRCSIADDIWALQARVEGRDQAEILSEARSQYQNEPNKAPVLKKSPQNGLRPASRPETQPAAASYAAPQGYESIDAAIGSLKRRYPNMVVEEINKYFDDLTGEIAIVALRYRKSLNEKKDFYQLTEQGGRWSFKGLPPGAKSPMFNWPLADGADRIVVVEGEKSCHAINALGIAGLAAVTSLGGSKNGKKCNWSHLRNKVVYLWPDNDEEGAKYLADILEEIKQFAASVYVVRIDELGLDEHGDAADYLRDNSDDPAENVATIESILYDADLKAGASDSLQEHFGLVASGKFKLIPFPQKPHLTASTQAMVPGAVTLICGNGGSGKSFAVLEDSWRLIEAGVQCDTLMLESSHAFHLRRALAQMSGNAKVLNHEYTERNIDEIQALYRKYRDRLDVFGRSLTTGFDKAETIFGVADWIEEKARNGSRVIKVDPITAAERSKQEWNDDLQFMKRVKATAERYGCSVVLVTHPKQGGKPDLANMAGGQAFARLCDTMIWMRRLDEPQSAKVDDGYGSREMDVLRTFEVFKARNGVEDKHVSRSIAVELEMASLCVKELGMVV